jgi:condensin complex subunit 1
MCVSSQFCESHLRLIFTLLQSGDEHTRANIAIALGDLASRFPNLMEPWTPHIYARLQDPAPPVRKNMLAVLTHLILNDMIKVRGQIYYVALCLEDADPNIQQSTRLFFHELAQKGTIFYNLLPDILSQLSADQRLSKETIKTIMKQLLALIQKDRQAENLMEKLCLRLHAAKDQKCWEEISYCLSLLTYNEHALKKLAEMDRCYAHAISHPLVYAHFKTIITKAKKFAKTEQKAAVLELEKRIELLRKQAAGEDEDENENENEKEDNKMEDEDEDEELAGEAQPDKDEPPPPQKVKQRTASGRSGGERSRSVRSKKV